MRELSSEAARPTPAAQKRMSAWAYIKREKMLYIMMLPVMIYFIIDHYIPMLGIVIAFKNYSPVAGIIDSPWVGLMYFENLFQSPDFFLVLKNTVIISLYRLMFGFTAPIILSLLINEIGNTKYKKIIQTISYLPHFLSWVIVAGLISTMLSVDGPINTLRGLFGIEKQQMLTNSSMFRGILVVTGIWKEVGWGTLFYLAAIAGINSELYEAARIDGASRWKQTLYITLPSIKGVVVILLIMQAGTVMNAGYEQVLLLQNPMVRNVSEILDTYIYKTGLQNSNYSFATAVGFFKCVVNMILILTTNLISKRMGEEGLW